MAYQTVFKRYELKYMLNLAQKARILEAMSPYMMLDNYGKTTIQNVYLDTENYRIIRRSLEKPDYKEKLRIRSYGEARPDSTVFVELKKKYDKVVYKRRVSMCERDAVQWVRRETRSPIDTQISREIDYFMEIYGRLSPTVFLSYEREAYFDTGGGDFRVTFDGNILARREDVSLTSRVYGTPLLDEGQALMELKCSGGIPLWMTRLLSSEHIYKTSFSKYGRAYEALIFPEFRDKIMNKEEAVYGCNF